MKQNQETKTEEQVVAGAPRVAPPKDQGIPITQEEVEFLKTIPQDQQLFELAWLRYQKNILSKKPYKYTHIEIKNFKVALRFGYWFHAYGVSGELLKNIVEPKPAIIKPT